MPGGEKKWERECFDMSVYKLPRAILIGSAEAYVMFIFDYENKHGMRILISANLHKIAFVCGLFSEKKNQKN